MALHKVVSVKKTNEGLMLNFTQPGADEWGGTMSVTVPITDAKKLADMVHTALHSKGAGK